MNIKKEPLLRSKKQERWIYPNGNGSASSDGIIIVAHNDGINIECILIKCPIEVRDMCPIKQALSVRDVDYIDGESHLITTHPFYHEFQ